MAKQLFAKAPDQKEFKILQAGSYAARCYSIIDLGTQEQVYKVTGEIKTPHEIRISWEFPTELETFREENGQEPFSISNTYTLSLGDKANLKKTLEGWLGRKLTEDEKEQGFDLKSLIGKDCLIQVVHVPNKDGTQTYANIQSIGTLPKGMTCPDAINPTTFFVLDTDDFDQATFDGLHEKTQNKIKESKEWKEAFDTPEFSE